MTDPFQIDLGQLKTRAKQTAPDTVEKVDRAGEAHGFTDRSPKKRRGRPPSPRTGQVHAKVLPHVSEEISAEAKRRGVQQGVLLEEAWTLYRAENGLGK
ncbi:chromosome partitioning protein ParB [Paracoccus sp. p3-h83]|uniref:chromosome partitioning protein ParB n=1 Tax=Paracoccus sp. p3-h83 TaxID=3342805 RepID=UPI0035B85A2E